MKNFKEFILEQSSKFVTVDYKIIQRDFKTDNPNLLIYDFKIITSENGKNKIKAKGYILTNQDGYKKTKAWIHFDDFKDDKTRIVYNKNFENGTKKIKTYS